MRTKTMLLSAALFAAGALSSMAQSAVYSQNVVGYVTVNIYPGLNLVSAPLLSSDPNSNPETVLANISNPDITDYSGFLPAFSQLFVFNPTNSQTLNANNTFTGSGGGGFNTAMIAGGDGNWYDNNGATPPQNQNGTCPPGTCFFILNNSGGHTGNPPVTNTLTVVGTVIQGTTPVVIYPGINFLADPEPVAQDLCGNGFPAQDFDSLFTWGTGGDYLTQPPATSPWAAAYNQVLIGGGADSGGPIFFDSDNSDNPVTVVLSPGQGFVYVENNGLSTWTRTFTVQ